MNNFEYMQENIKNAIYKLKAKFDSIENDKLTIPYLENCIRCLHDYWNSFFHNHNKMFLNVTWINIRNSEYYRNDTYNEVSENFIDFESELQALLAAKGGSRITLSNSILCYKNEDNILNHLPETQILLCTEEIKTSVEDQESGYSSTLILKLNSESIIHQHGTETSDPKDECESLKFQNIRFKKAKAFTITIDTKYFSIYKPMKAFNNWKQSLNFKMAVSKTSSNKSWTGKTVDKSMELYVRERQNEQYSEVLEIINRHVYDKARNWPHYTMLYLKKYTLHMASSRTPERWLMGTVKKRILLLNLFIFWYMFVLSFHLVTIFFVLLKLSRWK